MAYIDNTRGAWAAHEGEFVHDEDDDTATYDADETGYAAQQADTDPAGGGRGLGGMVNVIGAVASLGLMVGICYWGYRLVVRDVSGVPVVRALEGPMRVQPKEPGGEPADHMGLAVNAVAAQGVAEPTADRLMLAPRPVSLTEEDQPMAASGTERDGASTASASAGRDDGVVTAATRQETLAAFRAGAVDELVAELTRGASPMSPDDEAATHPVDEAGIVQPEPLDGAGPDAAVLDGDDMTTPEPAVLRGPGLASSPRPKLRPTDVSAPAGNSAAEPTVAATVGEVDPDSLPAGTRLAQLGAFDSADVARAEWDRLGVKFADYLEGKSRVIQKASSGGRTFYRLRAMGFDDIADARRFCLVLMAENADCIPVTSR